MRYYVGGIPFSDDLSHSGIPGQKWGVRRFQNKDRTWTAAGKERYGRIAQKFGSGLRTAGEKLGSGLKTAATKIKEGATKKRLTDAQKRQEKAERIAAKKQEYEDRIGFKKKKISSFSNEQLEAYSKRLELENRYMRAMEANKPKRSEGKEFLLGLAKSGVTTIANKGFQTVASNMFDTKENKENKEQQTIDRLAQAYARSVYKDTNDPSAWKKAAETLKNIKAIRNAIDGQPTDPGDNDNDD